MSQNGKISDEQRIIVERLRKELLHEDTIALGEGLPERGEEAGTTILPASPEEHDDGWERAVGFGGPVEVEGEAAAPLLIDVSEYHGALHANALGEGGADLDPLGLVGGLGVDGDLPEDEETQGDKGGDSFHGEGLAGSRTAGFPASSSGGGF